GLLRDGRLVRLRARALRRLGRARQPPAGAGREGRAGGDGDRRPRHLLSPADPAPGRPAGEAPRRGTARGALALALGAVAAVFVAAFVLFDLVRYSPRVDRRWERMLAAPVGLVAGIMGGITNAPGTPLAVYFIALGMDKREFVRSVAFSFLIVKAVQLATLAWY